MCVVAALIAMHPDTGYGLENTGEKKVLVVGYKKQAPESEAYTAAVEELAGLFESEVLRLEERDYSYVERRAVMLEIYDHMDAYSERFGAPITSIDVREGTGVIEVGVDSEDPKLLQSTTLEDGTPIRLVSLKPQTFEFPSRSNDLPRR